MNNMNNMNELNQKINQIKLDCFDMLSRQSKEVHRAEMQATSWQDVIKEVIRLIELNDPSVDELLTKIRFLMKYYKKNQDNDIPIDGGVDLPEDRL